MNFQTLWIADILYMLGMMFTKLSILCWYTVLFYVYRSFRYICFAMMAFCCAYSIAFAFLYSFFCHPEVKEWNLQTVRRTCLDIYIINEVVGALNLGSDLVLLCLPLPLIANLQLRLKQKLGLLAILTTGIL